MLVASFKPTYCNAFWVPECLFINHFMLSSIDHRFPRSNCADHHSPLAGNAGLALKKKRMAEKETILQNRRGKTKNGRSIESKKCSFSLKKNKTKTPKMQFHKHRLKLVWKSVHIQCSEQQVRRMWRILMKMHLSETCYSYNLNMLRRIYKC